MNFKLLVNKEINVHIQSSGSGQIIQDRGKGNGGEKRERVVEGNGERI